MSEADKIMLITIGDIIRAARKKRKLSQFELSGLVGVTEQHISAIECGKTNASIVTLLKIMLELSLSFDKLHAEVGKTDDSRMLLLISHYKTLSEQDQETVFQTMLILMSQLKHNK